MVIVITNVHSTSAQIEECTKQIDKIDSFSSALKINSRKLDIRNSNMYYEFIDNYCHAWKGKYNQKSDTLKIISINTYIEEYVINLEDYSDVIKKYILSFDRPKQNKFKTDLQINTRYFLGKNQDIKRGIISFINDSTKIAKDSLIINELRQDVIKLKYHIDTSTGIITKNAKFENDLLDTNVSHVNKNVIKVDSNVNILNNNVLSGNKKLDTVYDTLLDVNKKTDYVIKLLHNRPKKRNYLNASFLPNNLYEGGFIHSCKSKIGEEDESIENRPVYSVNVLLPISSVVYSRMGYDAFAGIMHKNIIFMVGLEHFKKIGNNNYDLFVGGKLYFTGLYRFGMGLYYSGLENIGISVLYRLNKTSLRQATKSK